MDVSSQFIKVDIYMRLKNVEIPWRKEWFYNISRFPVTHWESAKNCKAFMDEIASKSNVHTTSDWRKVTLAFIKNNGGTVTLKSGVINLRGTAS